METFEVEQEQCHSEVFAYLQKLAAEGLIIVEESGTTEAGS
jgi:hypothetical protein